MDVYYDITNLDYMRTDEELTSAGSQTALRGYLRTCSGILAGIACLLNIAIVITVMDFKLKTHLKLVLSLAFSDCFLAAFLVSEKYVTFFTPWSPAIEIEGQMSFNTSTFNISTNNTEGAGFMVSREMHQFPIPFNGGFEELLESFLQKPMITGNTPVTEKTLNSSMDEWDEFTLQSIFPLQNINSTFEIFLSNYIENNPLKIVLASAYLIPNITSILTMFFIAICMLISVTKPLQYKIILSKSRGTVLVLTIWGFAFAIAGIVFSLSMTKSSFVAATLIYDTQICIWYGGLLAFSVISVSYGIIFAVLHRQKFKHPSRFAVEWKAAVTALSVIVTFAICNMPIVWIYLSFPFAGRSWVWSEPFLSILELLFVLNTIMDPVIYSIRLNEVADGGKKILARLKSLKTCFQYNKEESK